MPNKRFYLANVEETTPARFVEFWKEFYDEGKYKDSDYKFALNIGGELDENKIELLFKWKIAHEPWKNQRKIVYEATKNVHKINQFRKITNPNEFDVDTYLNLCSTIVETGVVWKVFLLHISRPLDFPIFDQHVYRSYKFISSKIIWNESYLDSKQLNEYLIGYVPFFKGLVKDSNSNSRDVDRALMAFGQFIKGHYKILNSASES